MTVVVLVLSLLVLDDTRGTAWLALPVAALIVLFAGGVSLAVSSLNAILRDVEFIVSALLLPWFFLTPILYPLEALPGAESHPWLVDLIHWGNPMTPAIESFRAPLFLGEAPPAADFTYLVVATAVALVARRAGVQVGRRPDRGRSVTEHATVEERVRPVVGRQAEMLGRLQAGEQRRQQQRAVEARVASSGCPPGEPAGGASPAHRAAGGNERRPDRRPALLVCVEHAPRPVRRRDGPGDEVRDRDGLVDRRAPPPVPRAQPRSPRRGRRGRRPPAVVSRSVVCTSASRSRVAQPSSASQKRCSSTRSKRST